MCVTRSSRDPFLSCTEGLGHSPRLPVPSAYGSTWPSPPSAPLRPPHLLLLQLVDELCARLRLRRLCCLGAEAVHEALQPRNLLGLRGRSRRLLRHARIALLQELRVGADVVVQRATAHLGDVVARLFEQRLVVRHDHERAAAAREEAAKPLDGRLRARVKGGGERHVGAWRGEEMCRILRPTAPPQPPPPNFPPSPPPLTVLWKWVVVHALVIACRMDANV
eukprot:356545-Chlamydomonas_euryale.AAC.3